MIGIHQRYIHASDWSHFALVPTLADALDELKSPLHTPIDGTLIRATEGMKVVAFGAFYEGQCMLVRPFRIYAFESEQKVYQVGLDWERGWNGYRDTPSISISAALACGVDRDKIIRAVANCINLEVTPDRASLGEDTPGRSAGYLSRALESDTYKEFAKSIKECLMQIKRRSDAEEFYRDLNTIIHNEITLIDLMKNIGSTVEAYAATLDA